MKYVTEEQVKKEIELRKKFNGGEDISITDLINYYCQGAVTTVSNRLFDYLENDCYLIHGGYNWKHDCPVWEIRGNDDDEEVLCFESFCEFIDSKYEV